MPELTLYEARQVAEIAAWKSERPGLLAEAIRGVSRPLARLVSKAVPRDQVRRLIEVAEEHAPASDRLADLLREAGASSLEELRNGSLERCDALAAKVATRAELTGLIDGAVPALGAVAVPGSTVATAAVEMPLVLEAALGAIRRIGHCYGYALDTEADRQFVVTILDLASTTEPRERRAESEENARRVAPSGPGEPRPADVEHVEESAIEDLVVDAVPVVGDVAPIVLDYAFIRRVDVAARRAFQERWLRDRGKVESIAPAREPRRRGELEEATVLVGRLAYAGGYAAAFGATLPASLIGAGLARLPLGPVGSGLRDGARDASRDAARAADGFRSGIRDALASSPPSTPAPAPAAG